METRKKMTLAIETAIDGGSLSLLEGNNEIDHWIGESEISKSEDVVRGLSILLKRNSFKAERIGLIAVSTGAGSLTGLKIGLATARGLAKALNCRLVEVSLWDVLGEFIARNFKQRMMVLLPGSKNGIVCRKFEEQKFSPQIHIISNSQLQTNFESYNITEVVAHRRVIQEIRQTNKNLRTFDLGTNFAGYIGRFASDNELGIF